MIMILSASVSACSREITTRAGDLSRIEGELDFGGLKREYVLLVPPDLTLADSYALVLALHGGGGDARRMCSLRGGIQEFAADEKFFVLCPAGVDRHWNDGRAIDRWRAHADDIDDVGFLQNLVSLIIEQHPVDPSRVFVTGMSNGGKMSLRLACEQADIFRASAPVIASMPADLRCEPVEPISILIMNGTADPLVPWQGGHVMAFGRSLGAVWSTPRTMEFWVDQNHCDPEPERSHLPDSTPSDGSSIEIERYSNCQAGVQVTLFSVNGGGHTWPGGAQYLPEFLIGSTNRDAHAGELIWNFFEQVASQ